MAFKFISRTSSPIFGAKQQQDNVQKQSETCENSPPPKLTNSQLNKMAKVYPSWLRDSSGPKQLPGVYQGVLGQVQAQPALVGQKPTKEAQMDYMNRFTDTERVYQLLSASLLSNETLATIWAHVNQTYPGQLTNREVCLALALVAIFQRLDERQETTVKDPFSLVKLEKKPPVPKLYPVSQPSNKQSFKGHMTSSKSSPDGLNSATKEALLVDFGSDIDSPASVEESPVGTKKSSSWMTTKTTTTTLDEQQSIFRDREKYNNTVANLIDMNGDNFEYDFNRLTQTWMKTLAAMKNVFKRSFDILNVEHGRQSTIEALKCFQGEQFIKHICLCYPLAHNIKSRIDELNSIKLIPSGTNNNPSRDAKQISNIGLFDKNYINLVDDLMISINEYWAVLINLFHESGQTSFIELIMDSLSDRPKEQRLATLDELVLELDLSNKTELCSICHTQTYLTIPESRLETLESEQAELVAYAELLSEDNHIFYYHARCANFWLNQVCSTSLPFQKIQGDAILSPIH